MDSAELVLCCEVLEHLHDPGARALEIARRAGETLGNRQRAAGAALARLEPGAAEVRAGPSETPPATFSTGRGARSSASSTRRLEVVAVRTPIPGRWLYAKAVGRPRRPTSERAGRAPDPFCWPSPRWASPGGSRCTRWDGRNKANHAQVRALAAGQAEIDRWHWETRDKAWFRGHFYSVKAPGLAAFTLPAYSGPRRRRRPSPSPVTRPPTPGWRTTPGGRRPPTNPDLSQYAYSAERAHRVEVRVENGAPIVWG